MSGRAPDVVGEVVGWRAWRVFPGVFGPPLLGSIFHGVAWRPGRWTVAECPTQEGGVPHQGHGCGIYAARDRAHLVRQGYNDDEESIIAVGEVGLAGDVIRCTCGWRAEKARPIRLWLAHEHWQLVRPLSKTYGIPVDLSNILAKGGRREHRA